MNAGRLATSASARNLLRVKIEEITYAIEIGSVRELINPLPVIDLPHDDSSVIGVSDYRNHVLTVIDLRRLFGLPPIEREQTKWVVLRAPGSRLVAVVVDAVVDVIACDAGARIPVPELDMRQAERGIDWAVKHEGELVFVLAAERIAEAAHRVSVADIDSARSQ